MHSFDTQFTIQSPTSAALNVYHTAARGKAHGIVHINHGLAEHAARYAKFARDLSDAGFHVYAHDHRGHGYTKAKDAPQGIFSLEGDGLDNVLEDCAAVQDHATGAHPDLRLHMFGHSMGGLITMNFVLGEKRKLLGASIWNSNFDGGILGRLAQAILKYERFRLGSDVPSRILPKLTFQTWAKQIKNRRTDFDWLSHINDEVDAYIDDPLCGWDASVGMWLDIFEMVFAGGRYGRDADKQVWNLPFMDFVGGDQDPATNKGRAVENLTSNLKSAPYTTHNTKIFAGARHETLNDTAYDEALKHMIGVLDYTCQVPSAARSSTGQ